MEHADRRKPRPSPLAVESFRLKNLLRPLKSRERRECADLTLLDNAAGFGWLPKPLAAEDESLRQAAALPAKDPSAAELSASQNKCVEKALAALRAIR